ncbi:hypothetical protein Zm00014a_001981 [Zea mays]|uniref:Uncharacterized protein n=2 Tax=Zea mays TaxID=4577 RepID=A0A8J8XDS0_MAIZE|nr:hypothetical protein ZEAMMB73_Zm00001d032844 [Zea mays]PWZ58890.1 hypothetical protein Zm00014a_001981 [Zea mays]
MAYLPLYKECMNSNGRLLPQRLRGDLWRVYNSGEWSAGRFLLAIRYSDSYSRKRYFVLEDAALRCFKSAPSSKGELFFVLQVCAVLQGRGGFFHCFCSLSFGVDLQEIRLMGVLQRIAIAYLLTVLYEIWIRGDEDVDYGYDLLKRYRY